VSEPLVSVIIPAYNAVRYIREAVGSVLAQDYTRLEIIVVDDGSTDNTLDEVPRDDARIRTLRQANTGPAAARNLGASVAKGEFLAFLDCDDVWLPGKLTAQIQHLLKYPEAGVVHGALLDWLPDSAGTFPPASSFVISDSNDLVAHESGCLYTRLLLEFGLCTSTVVVRRRDFERAGAFDVSFRLAEDYDLWLRLSRITQIHKLNRLCVLYRKHGGNITARPPAQNYAYRALIGAIESFGLLGPDGQKADEEKVERRLSDLCLGHAYLHFWWGDPCLALEALEKSRRHARPSIKTSCYWLAAKVRCSFGLPIMSRSTRLRQDATRR
jgi:glycosyltransferase involved in cell wall biosynthesis